MFRIDVDKLCWKQSKNFLKKSTTKFKDDENEYIAYGFVTVQIGKTTYECNAAVASTALYLLKSLMRDHIEGSEIAMLPSSIRAIIPDDDMQTVKIRSEAGSESIDWSIVHKPGNVELVLDDCSIEKVPAGEYHKEVIAFASKIEQFYNDCAPKAVPEDESLRLGYEAFWNEWRRRIARQR